MSNYLNHLAARALGRQGAVRPRLPSLFEPSVGAHAALPADPAEVETTFFERAPDAPSTIRPSAPPSTTSQESRPSTREPITWPMTPDSSRPAGPAGDTERASRAFGPATSAASPHGREPAEEGRPRLTSAEGEEEPAPPRRAAKGALTRINVVSYETRAADAPDVKAHAADEFTGAAAGARPPAAPLAAHEEARAAEEGRADAHRPAPAIAPRPAEARGFEQRSEPPHITVTIGRVEVRAVFPAPEAMRPPAPRAAPKPTLAEYLKQRERGR